MVSTINDLDETHAARVLQVVRVPYVNNSYCETVYNNQSLSHQHHDRVRVTRNHFCAGFLLVMSRYNLMSVQILFKILNGMNAS